MRSGSLLAVLGVVCLGGMPVVSQDNSPQGIAGPQFSKLAVPRLVRFSGTVRDAGARPLRGPVDVTFSLYSEEAGGEALWFETQMVEADAQGRYSVLLGAMHPDGLPMDLFTSGEARWLGVSVGRLPEQARVLLVAVPYALKAVDADTLGGKPATAFVASDQLKEQVQSEVKAQVTEPTSTTRTLVGIAPTPQVIAETSPATFTCATGGVCVQSTQNGAGGIALRGTTGSATGIAGIFDNLGGGKILSGRTTSFAEKFYVDSSGNLWAGGSLTANSFSGTSGAAVFGVATAGSGTAYGVRGQSASPSGTGVFGYATSPTGLTYGLLGSNLSASGTGLSGSASSPTGVTIGVRAVVQSPNGTAAIFDNLGGGKLLSARTSGYVEKFSVASNGNVIATGYVRAAAYQDPVGNPIPLSSLPIGVQVRGINYLAGCDNCSPLTDADDQKTVYQNVIGPMTITSVKCFSDAGTPRIQLQRDDGTPANIFTDNAGAGLNCSTSGATGTIDSNEDNLSLNDKIDFVMVSAGGVAKRVTVVIKTIVN